MAWRSFIISFQLTVTTWYIYPAWEVLTLQSLRNNYASLKQKFGTLQALVLLLMLPNATQIVDRVEKHVLSAKSDEAIVLRKSTTEDCTMLAVAAAIVAQVAISALVLEDLDKVHWTVEAAFSLSLTAGGLSVFYACLIQQRLNSCLTTDDVKDFFSRVSTSARLREFEQALDDMASQMRKMDVGDEMTSVHEKVTRLESMIKDFKSANRWKSVSFLSILMVKAPTLLMKYALGSFIVGLGISFGCLAFSDVGSQKPQGRYLALFTVYIVTSCLGLFIYYVPSILKDLELSTARRHTRFIRSKIPREHLQNETQVLESISALRSSDQQETYGERQSNEVKSCAEGLQNTDGSQPKSSD
ncbi:hypothetical protein BO94DRAFT_605837 [Aspergillus sclerotioniger CBS 115572]|uniref:Uncharacterized protein n=1 Tax=Aspergillus sclerotioniger CBS 115572 TaxID=1450535 RepID=A0A317VP10_9EURO|nr:hypothetical protein BO94DRAFT_605837 [Aspergillus sclerotioniger CBS 115572]PWY75339.1 hypothetical protein BO94DRAFT_605837 [Aspergillus sclerotioniger CBS 115572]